MATRSLRSLRRHVTVERRRGRTWRSIAAELGSPYGPIPPGKGAIATSLLYKLAVRTRRRRPADAH